MRAAAASYELLPGPGHLVMPFNVLVIMLLLGFGVVLAFLSVCQSKINLTLDPIDTPNSAACGARLLAPQAHVWRDAEMSALADMIQAALMLKYNKRKVG